MLLPRPALGLLVASLAHSFDGYPCLPVSLQPGRREVELLGDWVQNREADLAELSRSHTSRVSELHKRRAQKRAILGHDDRDSDDLSEDDDIHVDSAAIAFDIVKQVWHPQPTTRTCSTFAIDPQRQQLDPSATLCTGTRRVLYCLQRGCETSVHVLCGTWQAAGQVC